MRKLTILIILFLIVNVSFGQIKYEKGYFINTENQRTECLIKNMDWNLNPTHFKYKLENSVAPLMGDLTTVKEFGIYNYFKFIGVEVKIDRYSSSATDLIGDENPLWRKETLFLKLITDGKAKLYSYDSQNGRKFFYSVADSSINQLVYKKFLINFMVKITRDDQVSATTKNTNESQISPLTKNIYWDQLSPIAENNTYKDQLLKDLPNAYSSQESIEKITYTSEDLEKYFNDYNGTFGDSSTQIIKKTKKSYFNLKITPGINSSSLAMSLLNSADLNFKKNLGFRLGLELESVLPFNRNKWALVFEPTFQSYNSKTEDGNFSAKFNFIEFPIGMRYYLYLNDQNKIYLNCFYIPQFQINLKTTIESNQQYKYALSSSANWSFGGGFEHKRLSLETRYYTVRNMMQFNYFHADYSRFSIILGYKIFKGTH